MDAAHEAFLRMLMEHGEAHGLGGGMADLGRAFGMLGADEDCRGLDDNPERLQPDLIPGVVVRVRRDVTSPSFGWGAVTHDQIGVLRSRNQQDECKVAFESVGQGRWNCRANELEVVPSAENLCYTLVPAPAPPALSAERVASLSVRELKAELCARGVPLAGLAERSDLIGALLEAPPPPPPPLEAVLRRGDDGLRIGSAVQIRAGLDRPRGGWGDLEDHRHAVGRIVGMRTGTAGLALSGRVTTVLVAFPFSVGTWNAAPDELEAWDGDSTIKVGVCVQVRPGLEVSTPAATPLCTLHPHSHSSQSPPSIHSLASCLARTSLTLVRHLPPLLGPQRPRCDWPDGVDHSTVGLVRRVLYHGQVKVEFPSIGNSWFAFDLEELIPSAADAPPPPSAGTAPPPPPVPVPAPTSAPMPTTAPTLVATAREYCVYVRTTVATPGSETEVKVRARACPCSLRMLAPQGAHTLRNARLGRSSECLCHVFLDILRRCL